jgi:hypothetical protein
MYVLVCCNVVTLIELCALVGWLELLLMIHYITFLYKLISGLGRAVRRH